MLKEMIYLRLVQGIGDLVCEGCCDDPDCGLDPKECSRILEAVEMLASFDIGKESEAGDEERTVA